VNVLLDLSVRDRRRGEGLGSQAWNRPLSPVSLSATHLTTQNPFLDAEMTPRFAGMHILTMPSAGMGSM